jgi:hypothetical protein
MAQTGYTPILIYSSSTASNAPAVGNLTNSTLGSELAINITDGKLFYKDNANAIQVIGWKTTPTTAGGTGLTSYTAGDLLYYASGTTLSKLAIGSSGQWLGSSGTAPQWNAPAALTKTDDTNVTLTLGGSASTALLNAASLTLGWTGTLATTRGGTGLSSFTSGGVVYASSTSALTTGTALTINATGNIGVSQTQANWSSGGNITLGGNKAITTATENANFGANWYYNGGYTYIANGAATNYYQASGNHIFQYAASGTAGNTFSFSEAGRFDTSGNYVPGAANKGINFTANTALAGMTSQLLNWYETGTYTPTVTASSGTLTTTSVSANYTRIGRQVTVNIQITLTNIGTASGALVATLPYTCGAFPAIGAGREDQNTGNMLQARIPSGTPSSMSILTYSNTTVIANGNVAQITITYFV